MLTKKQFNLLKKVPACSHCLFLIEGKNREATSHFCSGQGFGVTTEVHNTKMCNKLYYTQLTNDLEIIHSDITKEYKLELDKY